MPRGDDRAKEECCCYHAMAPNDAIDREKGSRSPKRAARHVCVTHHAACATLTWIALWPPRETRVGPMKRTRIARVHVVASFTHVTVASGVQSHKLVHGESRRFALAAIRFMSAHANPGIIWLPHDLAATCDLCLPRASTSSFRRHEGRRKGGRVRAVSARCML